MIAAVLDTNVLAPALRGVGNPNNVLGELIRRWRDGRYHLIVSDHILSELRRTLENSYFSRSLILEERQAAVALLEHEAEHWAVSALLRLRRPCGQQLWYLRSAPGRSDASGLAGLAGRGGGRRRSARLGPRSTPLGSRPGRT